MWVSEYFSTDPGIKLRINVFRIVLYLSLPENVTLSPPRLPITFDFKKVTLFTLYEIEHQSYFPLYESPFVDVDDRPRNFFVLS